MSTRRQAAAAAALGTLITATALGVAGWQPTPPPAAVAVLPAASAVERPAGRDKPDIRKLSQHFLDPSGNTAPWVFVPRENIKSISTSENPGMATVWEAGKGKDVKGVLRDPIRLSDYPLPWEFHLGLVQNSLATKGLSEGQINYAIGLNLAVTFSDPATWPKDRSRLPPDTHSLQLFIVHLGNQGEVYRQGVPQVKRSPLNFGDHSPEVYLVYGRGDLAANLNGNWNMGYAWVGADPAESGTSVKDGGPANPFVRFRVSMRSRTFLQVGVGSGDTPGWRMRSVDLSRFGKATGVWEIGPIFSLDRWIPDVLAKELKLDPPPWFESFRLRQQFLDPAEGMADPAVKKLDKVFRVQPPDPQFQYYVDYAVFYGNGPDNVEHLSEDFDVPGFLADQKYFIEGNGLAETRSNPGYLTVTLYGTSMSWAMCPILETGEGGIDLGARHPPPFEIEMAFIPPEPDTPWNLWWNIGLSDAKGKAYSWQPGVKNVPGRGCRYFNRFTDASERVEPNPVINPTFDPPLPQAILAHRPLYMLLQVPDATHARVGFKAHRGDRWTFSRPFDAAKAFGKIGKFAYPCLVSFQGPGVGGKGWGAGNYPRYQQFKIDYIHYRYGRSD